MHRRPASRSGRNRDRAVHYQPVGRNQRSVKDTSPRSHARCMYPQLTQGVASVAVAAVVVGVLRISSNATGKKKAVSPVT